MGVSVKYRPPMRRLVMLLAIVLASVGCGGGCGGAETPAPGTPSGTVEAEPSAAGEDEAPAAATAEPESEPEPEATPTVRVRGEVQTDGGVAIVIESRGEAETTLGPRIVVERQVGDGFEPVEGVAGVTLRTSCEVNEAPACTTLAPGAELRPPAWLGTIGDAQCICTRCGPAPAGVYRFVVESCHGTQRVEGEPFTLAAR